MMSFPENWSIDIAESIDQAIRTLGIRYEAIFDGIKAFVSFFLNSVEGFLFFLPWWVLLLMVLVGGYFATKRVLSALMFTVMIFVIGLFGYWNLMIYTLAIVFVSVLFSLFIGLPYGILMAENPRLARYSTSVLDAMQTMPSWVYLIPAVSFFGLGRMPAVMATMIYALPPVIRLTSHAISNVDSETLEAARAFGSTKIQALFQVKIPQAAGTIMAGINQTTMMAVAMVVTCSMIGAKGLGSEVLIAINRLEVGRGFEAGISIVFIAIVMDRLSQGVARSMDRKAKA
ncbi:MAG: ABC transporter permease subunit [Eubacteriales bacterium]|nr:ABC transporter permease subunit [Eubacteriales bacterium]